MASILDLLNTELGRNLISKVQNHTGEEKSKISSVLGMAMPLLLGALKNNAASEAGAESLDKALSSEKHNGDLLENIEKKDPEGMVNEGGNILNHILGAKQSGIIKTIAGTLNMNEDSVSKILKIAAPVIMNILGSQKRKDNLGKSDLTGLISSVIGNNSKHDDSLINTLLDKNGDGNVIDDIGGMLLGGGKKKKGGLLGGFTGGK